MKKSIAWIISALTFLWAIMSFYYWHIFSGLVFIIASMLAWPIDVESEPTKYNNYTRTKDRGPFWFPYTLLMLISVPFAPKGVEKKVEERTEEILQPMPSTLLQSIDPLKTTVPEDKVDSVLKANGIPVDSLDQPQKPVTKKKRKRSPSTQSSYIESSKGISGSKNYGRVYHTGPRGGCYYYSSSGRKVYVDRSYCY